MFSEWLSSVEPLKGLGASLVTDFSDTMSTRRLGNGGYFPCNTIDGVIDIKDNTFNI